MVYPPMSLEGKRRRGNEKRERKPFSLSGSCDNGRESFCWDEAPGGPTDGISIPDSHSNERERESSPAERLWLDRWDGRDRGKAYRSARASRIECQFFSE